jgi:hypothetical protein
MFKDVQSHGQSAFERRLAQPAACVPELLMQQTLPITSHYHTTSHHITPHFFIFVPFIPFCSTSTCFSCSAMVVAKRSRSRCESGTPELCEAEYNRSRQAPGTPRYTKEFKYDAAFTYFHILHGQVVIWPLGSMLARVSSCSGIASLVKHHPLWDAALFSPKGSKQP